MTGRETVTSGLILSCHCLHELAEFDCKTTIDYSSGGTSQSSPSIPVIWRLDQRWNQYGVGISDPRATIAFWTPWPEMKMTIVKCLLKLKLYWMWVELRFDFTIVHYYGPTRPPYCYSACCRGGTDWLVRCRLKQNVFPSFEAVVISQNMQPEQEYSMKTVDKTEHVLYSKTSLLNGKKS